MSSHTGAIESDDMARRSSATSLLEHYSAVKCEPEPSGDDLDVELSKRLNAALGGEFRGADSTQSSAPIMKASLLWLLAGIVGWILLAILFT